MTLSTQCRKWLSAQFGNAVLFDEPMCRHTYFNIGGPADALVKPASLEKLIELIYGCKEFEIGWWVMGKGSNLLVKDRGVRGVTILLDACLNQIEKIDANEKKIRVNAMAGASLQKLCRYALENGFGGLNFALGIPGSVGGAIMMNAGTALGSMENVVQTVKALLPSGEIINIIKRQMVFSYRCVAFTHPMILEEDKTAVLLEAGFSLYPGNPEKLKAEAESVLNNRLNTQPVDQRSPGCFFKNPKSGPPAGRLIEEAGLKGASIGDAQVSARHANFILNRGNATAADVLALMQRIQDAVNEKFNIFLEPEVKIVGE
jgi:UDP-N-acetylmuramate dehydrogenase